MPRSSRIVVPGLAHHVIQRGNRRQTLFFSDANRRAYCNILAVALERHRTRCLAWCLMDNHIHLMLVPDSADGLRAPLASAHTAYALLVNREQGLDGHLFQGRFGSYPMDAAHMMVAARYIENNPVKAGLVVEAEDWPWSSARAHIGGSSEGLTDVAALGQHIPNWRAMLSGGLEASGEIEGALRSGRPLAAQDWFADQGKRFGLSPDRPRRGRPKK